MKPKPQFLTKSRFKVGYECPTKLFFLDNKEFGNNNSENSFLESLAEGGFQVGELAKLYYPGGHEITIQDKNEAVKATEALLKRDSVIIYEAALLYRNLFVKADILVKQGNEVQLIEVKAKSFDPAEEDAFYNKSSLKKGKPKLSSAWEPYFVDIAFQTYVFKKAYPQFEVSSFLKLADKSAKATVDGLNQLFLLKKDSNGRSFAVPAKTATAESLGKPVLRKVEANQQVKIVWDMSFGGRTFEQVVEYLSEICEKQTFAHPIVGNHCKSCEFRIDEKKKSSGLKSGFETCWKEAERIEL